MKEMTNQSIQEMIRDHFNAKLCPKTAALFKKKYLLPNVRAAEYPNQDDLNDMGLAQLAFGTSICQVSMTDISALMLAARCGRPTLFLEKELGEILMKSKLPEDLALDDIQKQFPSLRVILPKGMLAIQHKDYSESILFIDIFFEEGGTKCPLDIAREIDANNAREFPRYMIWEKMVDLTINRPNNDAGIGINGTSSIRKISYGITKPWTQRTIADLVAWDAGGLHTNVPEMDDGDMIKRVEHLGLNILILLSAVPAEYEPDHVLRKARSKGSRIIPALLQPKWVGDHMLRARHAGLVKGEITKTGKTIASHWVSPHWRRQPYGKGLARRKLIWILPYHTGPKDQED